MDNKCLKGWIGIGYPNETPSGSGIYINQLPGITLKSLQSITNEDQISFGNMWSDVEQRSLTSLKTAVINYFGKKTQLVTVNEDLRLPDYINTEAGQITAPSAQYRGFTYDLGWWGSDLAAIHIEDLRLYAIAPATAVKIVVLDVYSTYEGVEIDSFTVDLTAGWNVIKVRKTYSDTDVLAGPFKIFVGYDATAITSPLQPLSGVMNGGPWYDWLNVVYTPLSPYQGVLHGATWDKATGIANNLNEVPNLFGLGGTIGALCSYEPVLCSQRSVFTTCLWYLMGKELMSERIFSDRLNRYTTIDLNRARELADYFDMKYREEMKAVFEGIDMTTWDGCTKCVAQYQLVHSLP